MVVGVFIVAYMANVGLDGGHEIKQHSRGILMLVGAAVGFVVGGIFGGPSTPGEPGNRGETKINEPR